MEKLVEISFRRSLLHLITCIWDTREARYRYLSEPFRRSGQLFREIRNYVRVGNWCDPAVTDVYMYIYTEILFENKRISFWEMLRRVHTVEKRTNWTGNNKKSGTKRGRFCERQRSPCVK